jgi:hypothetical protein
MLWSFDNDFGFSSSEFLARAVRRCNVVVLNCEDIHG